MNEFYEFYLPKVLSVAQGKIKEKAKYKQGLQKTPDMCKLW